MKSKVILLIIIVAIFFLPNCGKQYLNKYITWEGYIFDTIGGKPVSGVSLQLNACLPGNADSQYSCSGGNSEFTIGTATTDSKGYFKIYGKAARTDNYFPMINGPYGGGVNSINSQFGVGGADLSTTSYTTIFIK